MKSESDEVFKWFKKISSDWNRISNDFVNKEFSFLTSLNCFLETVRTEKEQYNKNHFNIFSAISEIYCPDKNVYEKENPNSDILRLLLDPNTDTIGNKIVLQKFFEFIGLADYASIFPNFDNIRIIREKHRIDIYIHDNKNAVIIESKLNGAPHQDFQLARYYKAAQDDELKVIKIVYLTLNPIGKLDLVELYQPSRSKKYTPKEQKEYQKIGQEIEKQQLITYISAVNSDGKESLSNFFKKCSKTIGNNDTNNEILKILLMEYSKLLVKLAGEEKMTYAERKLIEKIYNSKDYVQQALEFIDVWKKKDQALRDIFQQKFTKDGWHFDSREQMFYKIINSYALYVNFQRQDKKYPITLEIGFWEEKSKKWNENALKNLLHELVDENNFLEVESADPYTDPNWCCIFFIYNAEFVNNIETIDSYFENFLDVVECFESKVKELQK